MVLGVLCSIRMKNYTKKRDNYTFQRWETCKTRKELVRFYKQIRMCYRKTKINYLRLFISKRLILGFVRFKNTKSIGFRCPVSRSYENYRKKHDKYKFIDRKLVRYGKKSGSVYKINPQKPQYARNWIASSCT